MKNYSIKVSEKSTILTKVLSNDCVVYMIVDDKTTDVFGVIGKQYNHNALKMLGLTIYKGGFLRNSEGLTYQNRYVTMATESLESRLQKLNK